MFFLIICHLNSGWQAGSIMAVFCVDCAGRLLGRSILWAMLLRSFLLVELSSFVLGFDFWLEVD